MPVSSKEQVSEGLGEVILNLTELRLNRGASFNFEISHFHLLANLHISYLILQYCLDYLSNLTVFACVVTKTSL